MCVIQKIVNPRNVSFILPGVPSQLSVVSIKSLILLYCEMTGLKDMQSSMEFLNVVVWHFHNLILIEITGCGGRQQPFELYAE